MQLFVLYLVKNRLNFNLCRKNKKKKPKTEPVMQCNMIRDQYIYFEQQFPHGGQLQRSDIIVDFSSFILIYSQQCKISD